MMPCGLYNIDHLSQDGEDQGAPGLAQACAAADESAVGRDRTAPARKKCHIGYFIDRVINFVQTARGRLGDDG
jgi:hypothetical protein